MTNKITTSLRKLFHKVFKHETIRRIVENSSYLLSATGITMVTSMVQGIFIFRMIGPLGFGLVEAIRQFASNANRLTTFRIYEMMVTYVRKFEEQGKREKAAAVYKLAILFESSGAVIAFGLIWLLAPWGASFFGQDSSTLPLWIMYGIFILFNFCYESTDGLLQVFNRFRAIAVINVLQGVATLVFVLLAFFTGGGVQEVLVAYIIGKVVGGLSMTVLGFLTASKTWGKDWWRVPLRSIKEDRRDLLSFAFSANLSSTITLVTRDSEALWVSAFLGLEIAGYYQLAYKIVNIVLLPISYLAKPTYPEISRDIVKERWDEVKDTLFRGSRLAALYTLPLFLVFLFAGKPLLDLFYSTDSFDALPAYPLIMTLIIGYVFVNIFFWNRYALLALNRPVYPTVVYFIGMLLKIGAIFLFAEKYGEMAFAAIMAGYFIFTVSVTALRVVLDLRAKSSPIPAPG